MQVGPEWKSWEDDDDDDDAAGGGYVQAARRYRVKILLGWNFSAFFLQPEDEFVTQPYGARFTFSRAGESQINKFGLLKKKVRFKYPTFHKLRLQQW